MPSTFMHRSPRPNKAPPSEEPSSSPEATVSFSVTCPPEISVLPSVQIAPPGHQEAKHPSSTIARRQQVHWSQLARNLSVLLPPPYPAWLLVTTRDPFETTTPVSAKSAPVVGSRMLSDRTHSAPALQMAGEGFICAQSSATPS